MSYDYLYYYDYGNDFGDYAEQNCIVAPGSYCYASFYNGLTGSEDDQVPVASAELVYLCEDCMAYAAEDLTDEEWYEMVEGEWMEVDDWLYVMVFNYGTTDGDFTVTGSNGQVILMGLLTMFASLIYML